MIFSSILNIWDHHWKYDTKEFKAESGTLFKRVKRVFVLCTLAVIVTGALLLLIISWYRTTVSGKIISAKTRLPISDAMVVVESALPWEEIATDNDVRTDISGRFTTKVRINGWIRVRAWKSGYAMNGNSWESALNLPGKEIILELRELASGNYVPENNDRDGFGVHDGFSFRLGRVVKEDDPSADIKLVKDSEKRETFIESLGEGGVFLQPYSPGVDFYNTPEAPHSGYVKRLTVNTEGIYYVLARDGKHYAKVGLIPGFKNSPRGEDYSAYWLRWAISQMEPVI
jgi:hypothetical protein